MILAAFLLLIVPAFLLLSLWRARFQWRGEWVLESLFVGSYLGFVLLTGRWDFFSVHLRLLLPLLFVGVAYVAYSNSEASVSLRRPVFQRRTSAAAKIVFTCALLILNLRAVGGRSHGQVAVELAFPLKQGAYYIGGGGNSRWINGHQAGCPCILLVSSSSVMP